MHKNTALHVFLVSCSLAGLLASCGSDSGSGGVTGFQLTRISLQEDEVWEVNREIVFTFNEPIDFSSVSLNTINIKATSGAPATGSFFLRGPLTVVFQPTCPLLEDLSDSGLQPGGIAYVITVVGESSGAGNTVRSTSGEPMQVTQVRNFTTPPSTDPATAFLDTELGPPVPVNRGVASTIAGATYLELGGDPTQRVYFELDAQQNVVFDEDQAPAGFSGEIPLNLYSEPASEIAVVIEFNQPVNPSSTNISSSRLRIEFLDPLGAWQPIGTLVTLVANCTEVGARVRLEPIGILPPATDFRAVVLPGFQDLVGQTSLLADEDFALGPTETVDFASLSPSDDKSDELFEGFQLGGTGTDSHEDTEAVFATPKAEWSGGSLSAAFDFEGTGGPGGMFDWVIGEQFPETLEFDTTSTLIVDVNGVPQLAVGGVVDVHDMTIREGSEVRVLGPNPLRINATGEVRIDGRLTVSGLDAKNVTALNQGNVTEIGAAGAAGGGRGGNANDVVTNSTPIGGTGQGPFEQLNTGGQGGETGFAAPQMGKDARRPGGGGGGRFALDQGTGLSAESGFNGSALARGGVSMVTPPQGGAPGAGPFEGDAGDDFLGDLPVTSGPDLVDLVHGELPSLWAGYGGGGGGNADPSAAFPTPNWTPASDEKGGAGGGGGGGVHIRSLGRIVFGAAGRIAANGGRGATGENTLNLDHVGGSGGSGSGGHVILESASLIDFTDGDINVTPVDWISALGGPRVTGPATTGGDVSFGGAGGPGVVQLLVPHPLVPPGTDPLTTDIVVPVQAAIATNPIDEVVSPAGLVLVPTFGSISSARSEWISIGGADQDAPGAPDLVRFLFGGIQTSGPDAGKVVTSGGSVTPLAPLLSAGLDPAALVDDLTLEISGTDLEDLEGGSVSGISNDIYLRTPALLEDFVLRLESASSTANFRIVDAQFEDDAADDAAGDLDGNFPELRLLVEQNDASPSTLQEFLDLEGPGVTYHLVPRFFRVVTGGEEDALPDSAFVQIRFQAAADDGSGNPDETTPLVPWTSNIEEFNLAPAGAIQFFRFEVQFDLDAQSMGVSSATEPVTLDFLRIPFVF